MKKTQGVWRESASVNLGRPVAGKEDSGPRVLAVGAVAPEILHTCDPLTVRTIRFDQLDAEVVTKWRPTLVLSPLVGNGYDCIDVAQVLVTNGFTGRYRAAVTALPNPSVVRREVASHFPGLDFDVLVIGRSGGPAGAPAQ